VVLAFFALTPHTSPHVGIQNAAEMLAFVVNLCYVFDSLVTSNVFWNATVYAWSASGELIAIVILVALIETLSVTIVLVRTAIVNVVTVTGLMENLVVSLVIETFLPLRRIVLLMKANALLEKVNAISLSMATSLVVMGISSLTVIA